MAVEPFVELHLLLAWLMADLNGLGTRDSHQQ
jgi:hypothetical protein